MLFNCVIRHNCVNQLNVRFSYMILSVSRLEITSALSAHSTICLNKLKETLLNLSHETISQDRKKHNILESRNDIVSLRET